MRSLFIFAVFASAQILNAQKHDFVWVTGDNNGLTDTTYGGSLIDFNFLPRKVSYNFRDLNFRAANTSICDTSGRLLFYSNGCAIAGADDVLLENGDNINPGPLHDQFCPSPTAAYISGPQSLLTLPMPGNDQQYMLLHTGIENVSHPVLGVIASATRFYYSKIDMSLNGGKGKVVEKNVAFFPDTVSYGEICAVRHANGADWWIIVPTRYDQNSYYTFLLTANGLAPPSSQAFSFNTFSLFGQGQTCFTPDGGKYIRYRGNEGIFIFSFDRAAGVLSDMQFVDPPQIEHAFGGCGVAPNSRYLYLTNILKVYQLDLENPKDTASFQLVGTYDGFKADLPTTFGYCQLGPDCKLYICTGNDTKVYHIIHQPDKAGLACNLEQHGLILPTKHGTSIPFFPNFRLGPAGDPGMPCSPLTSTGLPTPAPSSKNPFLIYPNPFSDKINCRFYEPAGLNAPIEIQIFDITGQKVWEKSITDPAHDREFPIQGLAPGLFVCVVSSNGKLIQVEKIVKI